MRSDIIGFLDELLDSSGFPDYCPNGLQVPGTEEVTKVVTGVSASFDLFDEAHELEDVASNYFGISLSHARFDKLTRDEFSRVIWGARISLVTGIVSVIVAGVFALLVLVGALSNRLQAISVSRSVSQ